MRFIAFRTYEEVLPVGTPFAGEISFVSQADLLAAALALGWRGTGMHHATAFAYPAIGNGGGTGEKCYRCLHSRVIAFHNSSVGEFSLCNHWVVSFLLMYKRLIEIQLSKNNAPKFKCNSPTGRMSMILDRYYGYYV